MSQNSPHRFGLALFRLGLALATVSGAWAATPSLLVFTDLGSIANNNQQTTYPKLSADGSVAAGLGTNAIGGGEGYRWTAATGIRGIGTLSQGMIYSEARGISGNGQVIVGHSYSDQGTEAFRWTLQGGMRGLGDLPGGRFNSVAYGVSADGSVIVGQGETSNLIRAFRWTEATGMTAVPLPTGDVYSQAFAVSGNGQVVVGSSGYGFGRDTRAQAFLWSTTQGAVGLGDLPGGAVTAEAHAVSWDGSVVAGHSYSAQGREAFRWEAGAMIGLGDLEGGAFDSRALALTADGSIIVGAGTTEAGSEAFIWTAHGGMRRLADVAAAAGLDTRGWQLREATSISADGNVIAGWGVTPDGDYLSFTISGLNSIPEPAGLLGLAGLLWLGRRARNGRC